MKFEIKSLGKKLKENFSDLSGIEEKQDNSSKLLETLPVLIKASLSSVDGNKSGYEILPRLIQEMTKEESDNIVDNVLSLMAAALAERQNFTIYDYEKVLEHCQILFGEEALHTRFQAKLHAALLRDYSDEEKRLQVLENFRLFLHENKNSLNITQSFLNALYKTLYMLTLQDERRKYKLQSRFFEACDLLFMEYDIQKKKEKLFPLSSGAQLEDESDYEDEFLPKLGRSLNVFNKLKSANGKDRKKFFTLGKGQNASNLLSTTEKAYEFELKHLEDYALSFRNTVLLEQISAFRSLLIPQDFRVVVLGEGKRGKSSLINALLGENILPTKAILPETGTLIELFRANETSYEIEWISEYEFEELENILYAEESNLLLQKKFENLRKIFNNTELFNNLRSLKISRPEELNEFISADGLYTALIKKVRIGINSENIPQGILLLDTPAINASDPFYHMLTLEEALRADCLIVMLDARKPDSYSELQLLKELAARGRAIKIIGVLTHPPESSLEREIAKNRALQTLQEGVRGIDNNDVIEIVNVFMFNPKAVLENFERESSLLLSHLKPSSLKSTLGLQKPVFEPEYLSFVEAIILCVKEGIHSSTFSKRLDNTFNHLVSFAVTSRSEMAEQYKKNLPSAQHQKMLENHAKHLAIATEEYADHARSMVMAVHHDIENWRENSERAITFLEERIVLHISKAMHKHADSLGNNFSKESQWIEFDELDAPAIARALLDEFVAEQRAGLHAWEEKIQLFNNSMQELSMECFNEVQKISEEINVLSATNSKFDHMLVQTMTYMNRLTLFLGGAGTGLLASSGIVNALALGTATLAFLTIPVVLPTAVLIGATAYALRSFANPSKRKEYFLQRKEVKVREFASQIALELNKQLDDIQNELVLAYSQAVHKSLAPALEIMASEAVNIHLYLQVIEKQHAQLPDSE